MRFFPVFLDLDHQPVLVVGGGEQAAQKIRLLAKTKARIRVLAPEPCAEIAGLAAPAWSRSSRARWWRATSPVCGWPTWRSTTMPQAARAVAMCRAAGVPVNAVDRQELCDFITPAIVDRDPLVVAIGTEGTAPVLARQLKARLEAMLPARLGGLARWAASLRARAAGAIAGGSARRRFWDGFFDGPVARAYLAGARDEAARLVEHALAGAEAHGHRSGDPGRRRPGRSRTC